MKLHEEFGGQSGAVIFIDAAGNGACNFGYAVGTWLYPRPKGSPYLEKDEVDPNPGHGDRYLQPTGRKIPMRGPDGHFLDNPDYEPNPPPIFRLCEFGFFDQERRAQIGAPGIVRLLRHDVGRRWNTRAMVGDQFGDAFIGGMWREARTMPVRVERKTGTYEIGGQPGVFSSIAITQQLKMRGMAWIRSMVREKRLWLVADGDARELLERELLGWSEVPTSGGNYRYTGKSTDLASVLMLAAIYNSMHLMPGSPSSPSHGGRAELGAGDFDRTY